MSSHPRLVSYSTVEEDNDSCGFDVLDLDGTYGSARPAGVLVTREGRVCRKKDSEGKSGRKAAPARDQGDPMVYRQSQMFN